MKKQIVLKGRAESNGVIIYPDDAEVAFKAWIDPTTKEVNSNRSTDTTSEYSSFRTYSDKNFLDPALLISSAVLILISLFVGFVIKIPQIISPVFYFIAFCWFDIFWVFSFSHKKKIINSPEYKTAKFHGALHKVLNFYNQYQKVPTVSEVKNCSIISKHCGSNPIFSKAVMFATLTILYGFSYFINTAVFFMPITVLLGLVSSRFGWFKFMQKLIILEPDEQEISTVLEALNCYESFKYFRSDM